MPKIHVKLIRKEGLSPAEGVVLRLVCHGLGRKEIANHLNRSQSTVNSHVESIAEKLQCHSSAEIVATAVARRMVEIEMRSGPNPFTKLILFCLFITGAGFDDQQIRPPRPVRVARASIRTVNRQV